MIAHGEMKIGKNGGKLKSTYPFKVTWKTTKDDGSTKYNNKPFKTRQQALKFVAENQPQLAQVSHEVGGLLTPEQKRAMSLWGQFQKKMKGVIDLPPLELVVRNEIERIESEVASITLDVAYGKLMHSKRDKGVRYQSDLKSRCGVFLRDMGGGRIIATFTRDEIEDWLWDLDVNSNLTINHYRGNIFTLFEYCRRKEYCQKNPLEFIEKLKVGKPVIKHLSIEDTKTILEQTMDDDFRACFILQTFCGLRTQEIMDLNWENIKDDSIRVEVSKTGDRITPIATNALKMLEPLRKDSGAIFGMSYRTYFDRMAKVFKSAEVERFPNLLRHTFCTYRLADSQDLPRTALEAGNSPRMIKDRYAEKVPERDGRKFFRIKV